jgi:hypothetical protein
MAERVPGLHYRRVQFLQPIVVADRPFQVGVVDVGGSRTQQFLEICIEFV